MTTTAEVLSGMLQQSTGRALCDSGGDPQYDEDGKYIGSKYGYGRHWERNQGRDFEKEPETEVEFEVSTYRGSEGSLSVDVTHNVYHWLKSRLEYDEDAQAAFDKFEALEENEGKYWLQLMEEFPTWYAEYRATEEQEDQGDGELYRPDYEARGLYGEGQPMTINTYNGEDALSQTIQYVYFELCDGIESSSYNRFRNGEVYVVLQIHNGADVRGGYTAPKVFKVDSDYGDQCSLFDNARVTVHCTREDRHPTAEALIERQRRQESIPGIDPPEIDTDCDNSWDSENGGYSFELGNATERLEDFPVKELTDEDSTWEPGTICVDKDKNAYCPNCGCRLSACFY
jgi:hypothetical protein